MRAVLALLCLACASLPARAEWRLENGVAMATPDGGNSNITRLLIECGTPFNLLVYASGGPVLPVAGGGGEADYFYQPHRIEAEIDGQRFPLAAAGSDDAVVLTGQGAEANGYLADLDRALLDLLRQGRHLTLAFDVTPEPNAETDSPFETFARFSLDGADPVIGSALRDCPGS
ncbi:hypothetical protein [Nitratireductor pacificus]|uniref:Uncharacterized protein n=1 Tax=Nitratireductor pacificus pht-3B TaxID=391937 RepID=K2MAY8_9HYPH|nr:hypothetical protein [Nitratireductor pacificus]EKF18065.1 hypothetical protein NA2_15327 [Nitratireductor pacificus pht-3B]